MEERKYYPLSQGQNILMYSKSFSYKKQINNIVSRVDLLSDVDEDLLFQAIVITMRALPTKHPGGGFKPKEATEVEHTLAINAYKLEIDGEEIIEVDVPNNIFKVGGVDLLAEYRTNLGI